MTTTTTTRYTVDLMGSLDPADDQCWTGVDFETLEEARRVFEAPEDHFVASYFVPDGHALHVVLDGPGVHETRQLLDEDPRRLAAERRIEQQERAMQAGMAFGCAGYNDEMGW
jgi:hypothetical protein